LAGAGTQASALAFGGYTGTTPTTATEEWTGAGVDNKNNYSKLTGGKYGTYKNIHSS
jgi:hypothetical protein